MQGGRTVLFVSHNMATIANLCPRAILLKNGSIVETGDTPAIIDNYLKSIADLANTSLAERKDRRGAGQIIIKGLAFYDRSDEQLEYPRSGQDLIIRVAYESKLDRIFKNCRMSVLIRKDGRSYIHLSTELVNTQQLDLHGSGFIDFIVPELPLSEGNYLLHVYLESNGEMQDWIMDAAPMSVVDGDFYGTGRNYPSPLWRGATVLVKFDWKLGPCH
jgi:lipopolysaccharide transport system ATP-binding protein